MSAHVHSPANLRQRAAADLAHPHELDKSAEEESARRALLGGLVDYDGWHWNDVVHG
jgi:hypothetical protein